ncbi:TOBE-like domain-containing protein [Vulcanococcus limneticus]|uniref:TOBE-like domain-containing protein n=1 Tax=Vulcanococcus limneticus TaxID=2170428 RepID=UPI00398BFC68
MTCCSRCSSWTTVAAAPPSSRAVSANGRPHDLELLRESQGGSVPAVLRRITHLGKELVAELQLENGQTLSAQLPRNREVLHGLQNGDRLHVRPRAGHQF